MATFSQTPGQLNIKATVGSDFLCGLNFNTDISSYTFTAAIVTQEYPVKVEFPITAQVVSGVLKLSLSSAETQTIGSISNKKWYLNWSSGGTVQTILSGRFELSDIPIGQNDGTSTDISISTYDININISSISAMGATGLLGSTGATGPLGATGLGATGATGPQGATGNLGATGPSGPAGFGATGPQGIQGPSGQRGATGEPGTPGGATGATGIGATGQQGATGIQGSTGPQGSPGGATGTTGLTGSTGATGPIGTAGIDGDRYHTNSTTLLTLQLGSLNLYTSDLNLSYSIGQQIKIANTSSAYFDATVNSYDPSTGQLTATATNFVGSGSFSLWEINLSGAIGVQGATGATGAMGLTGATGVRGSTGLTGSTGPSGAGTGGGNIATNTASGQGALLSNTTGIQNTASGAYSLYSNTTGNNNTASGVSALGSNSTGGGNTASGVNALYNNTAFSNTTGLGCDAQVTASNQIQLGDSATTTYAYGAVQNRSDIRDKSDVRDTTLGLEFVNSLRPVDFKWDLREDYRPESPKPPKQDATEEEKATYKVAKDKWLEDVKLINITHDGSKKRNRFHHGFIAQEVKSVIDAKGIDFGGFQDHSINGGDDVLSIGYEELIAPIIKSIQELSLENEKFKSEIKLLKSN